MKPALSRNQPPFNHIAHSSNDIKKISILGLPVDALSPEAALDLCRQFMQRDQFHYVVTLNSLMILDAQNSLGLKKACEEASLMIPDSSGVSWAARTLKLSRTHRFPGVDLALELCRMAEDLAFPIYLLGGNPGVAEEAASYLKTLFPNLLIAGIHHGYFGTSEKKEIIEEIGKTKAKLVLVGMGAPKQELWIYEHRSLLPAALYIGVGGTFDIWSGRLKRAPQWARQLGLEWVFRLFQEPFRWRRISRLPCFAAQVLIARLRSFIDPKNQ